MQKVISKSMLVQYISIFFIIVAIVLEPSIQLFNGLLKIQTSPSTLVTDYFYIGGPGAAFLNSGILMLMSYLVVRRTGLTISGPIFAGIMTIGGFAFFGKNLINTLPIYLGVYLYAKHKKISFKGVIIVFLFSTGLAPVSSVIMFGLNLSYYISIPLGLLSGVFSGFMLVELASHIISFHKGYNLYNVGFAGGILAILYASIVRLTDISIETSNNLNTSVHWLLFSVLMVVCIILMIIGYIGNNNTLSNYNDILKKSGRAITDFTRRNRHAITLFNVGFTGMSVILFITLLNIKISGPVAGGIMTVIGFSAFGKHVKNIFPPMIGVVAIAIISGFELTSLSVSLAIIFSTAVAPISGEHGVLAGLLAGMIHLPIANTFSSLHGGILLYSNGFTAAFTAIIISTFVSTLKRSED